MKVWIDTGSGTWGDNPEEVVIVEITEEELEELNMSSDLAICSFGETRGTSVVKEQV